MFYHFALSLIEINCNNIESAGPIFDFILPQKKSRRFCHSLPLRPGDDIFGVGKIIAFSRLYFYENYSPVSVGHDKVNFSGLTGIIPGECFQAPAFEIFLTALLAPSAEGLAIGK